MAAIACKFGGTSVADADQVRKVAAIIRSDPRRRFIVVSAPGKRHREDQKITDLLYRCADQAAAGQDMRELLRIIGERFLSLAAQLGAGLDMAALLEEVRRRIREGAGRDYAASRGEYLCARLVADYLGARYVEAAQTIRFQPDGSLDETTYSLLAEALSGQGLFVVPGFYGFLPDGSIKTFSRGGSDITGAIVARAVGAEVYENWTDVSGFLMADPRIVSNPKPMRRITYREMRELACMGAGVLHEEAVFPVLKEGIPINIRNTNEPGDPGTLILGEKEAGEGPLAGTVRHPVAGIAGKTGFCLLGIAKRLINRERGFARRLFEGLEALGIGFELVSFGIDSVAVVLGESQLQGKEEALLEALSRALGPESISIQRGLALIAAVGEGLAGEPRVPALLFSALAQAEVTPRLIERGSSPSLIIAAVEALKYEQALRAVYQALSEL